MIGKLSTEKLYAIQRGILFLVVLLFPIRTILFYQKSFVSTFSFYGQISSIPLLIGLVLAILTCIREHTVKKLLFPVFGIVVLYVLLGALISLHSIYEYSAIGSFDAATFGETPKIRLLKGWLSALGITSDAILYGTIIFMRDTLNSVREIVFAFGMVVWIAFLSRKDFLGTFETARKAVLWSTALLTPYLVCEVLHLFGMGGATSVLKSMNSVLYEPGAFLGWYPPLVSPNQIRGTWTEPAYFAIWLAFAVPFFVSYFFKDGLKTLKKGVMVFALFTALFSIWFMTYSRTAIVLMAVLVGLYLVFAILFRTRENWEKATLLVVTCLLGFFITSTWGPQEVSRRASIKKQVVASAVVPQKSKGLSSGSVTSQKKIEKRANPAVNKGQESALESVFFQNTVKSTVDAKSRSNPARVEDFLFKIDVFKEYPIAGAGDSLASTVQVRIMKDHLKSLTSESRHRFSVTTTKGVFESGISGNPFTIAGMLANRGLLGFVVVFFPIFVLGIRLFLVVLKSRNVYKQIGIAILVSGFCVFLSIFTCGIRFYDFWCVAGIALGIVLLEKNGNELSEDLKLKKDDEKDLHVCAIASSSLKERI